VDDQLCKSRRRSEERKQIALVATARRNVPLRGGPKNLATDKHGFAQIQSLPSPNSLPALPSALSA
jgi:hypothetical protein